MTAVGEEFARTREARRQRLQRAAELLREAREVGRREKAVSQRATQLEREGIARPLALALARAGR